MNTLEKLSPFILEKVWGGTRLPILRGFAADGKMVGETWEVSRIKGKASTIEARQPLDRLLDPDELPYLVKYIDTQDNLSIQVHPDDEYASRMEKSSGKEECWIILDAKEGAGVYLGFKSGVDSPTLQQLLDEKKDISTLLNFYPVRKGDFIYVPPGAVHAIGGGILLVEVQQSSGITYRIWDWNRVDETNRPRVLHRDKALDVLNFEEVCNKKAFFRFAHDVFLKKKNTLFTSKHFIVETYSLQKGEYICWKLPRRERYGTLLLLTGRIILQVDDFNKKIDYNQTILIHKNIQRMDINCIWDATFIVVY